MRRGEKMQASERGGMVLPYDDWDDRKREFTIEIADPLTLGAVAPATQPPMLSLAILGMLISSCSVVGCGEDTQPKEAEKEEIFLLGPEARKTFVAIRGIYKSETDLTHEEFAFSVDVLAHLEGQLAKKLCAMDWKDEKDRVKAGDMIYLAGDRKS